MSGSATLATERFRLATPATRISVARTTPARSGASPSAPDRFLAVAKPPPGSVIDGAREARWPRSLRGDLLQCRIDVVADRSRELGGGRDQAGKSDGRPDGDEHA